MKSGMAEALETISSEMEKGWFRQFKVPLIPRNHFYYRIEFNRQRKDAMRAQEHFLGFLLSTNLSNKVCEVS